MTADPIPPARARRWRHKKRGSVIVEIGRGRLQTTPPQYFLADMDEMVIYLHEADGTIWCRARDEFEDGRFEEIAPSPQPPAPAAPDVAGLVDALDALTSNPKHTKVDPEGLAQRCRDALTAQAAEIARQRGNYSTASNALQCVIRERNAQATEIARLKAELLNATVALSPLDEVVHFLEIEDSSETPVDAIRRITGDQAAALAAKEAEIATQRFAIASRNETLSQCSAHIAELEAALRPFADLARAYPRPRISVAPEDVIIFQASDVRVTLADLDRAALSGKEPQQP